MAAPELVRQRIIRYCKQEQRALWGLTIFSVLGLGSATALFVLGRDPLLTGIGCSLIPTALVGLWKATLNLKERGKLDPELLELNPALSGRQLAKTQQHILPSLRQRQNMELVLAVGGLLTLMVAALAYDRFWAGIGIGLSLMSAGLLVFSIIRIWRVELLILEAERL